MDNFLETLKQVEAFTAENTVSVYCPISQLTLDFKPLTVTQTKKMIKSKIERYMIKYILNILLKVNSALVDLC